MFYKAPGKDTAVCLKPWLSWSAHRAIQPCCSHDLTCNASHQSVASSSWNRFSSLIYDSPASSGVEMVEPSPYPHRHRADSSCGSRSVPAVHTGPFTLDYFVRTRPALFILLFICNHSREILVLFGLPPCTHVLRTFVYSSSAFCKEGTTLSLCSSDTFFRIKNCF